MKENVSASFVAHKNRIGSRGGVLPACFRSATIREIWERANKAVEWMEIRLKWWKSIWQFHPCRLWIWNESKKERGAGSIIPFSSDTLVCLRDGTNQLIYRWFSTNSWTCFIWRFFRHLLILLSCTGDYALTCGLIQSVLLETGTRISEHSVVNLINLPQEEFVRIDFTSS